MFSHILLMAKSKVYFPHLVIQYNVLSLAAHYNPNMNSILENLTAATHNKLF